MKSTRKRLGKLFAMKKTPNYEQHYLEFKEEIDSELNTKPKETVKKTSRRA